MRYTVTWQGEVHLVEVRALGPDRYFVRLDDDPGEVISARVHTEAVHLWLQNQSHQVWLGRRSGERAVSVRGQQGRVQVLSPQAARVRSARQDQLGGGDNLLHTPMPGRIVKLMVQVGDTVQAGQGLVIVEAMKMENELRAGVSGQIRAIHCAAGDLVEGGALLVEIEAQSPEAP